MCLAAMLPGRGWSAGALPQREVIGPARAGVVRVKLLLRPKRERGGRGRAAGERGGKKGEREVLTQSKVTVLALFARPV